MLLVQIVSQIFARPNLDAYFIFFLEPSIWRKIQFQTKYCIYIYFTSKSHIPFISAVYNQYRMIFSVTVFAFLVIMGLVTSEGISHASHQMLKAAENGDTETVINYITKTGVPLTVKNNYGVRFVICFT